MTSSLLIQAFLIGIFPIWSEVIAGYITKIEPARCENKFLLYLDGLIDLLVFVVVPAIWFWKSGEKTSIESFALIMFFCCGLYRIVKFLKTGLSKEGNFLGLPVTYTGYIWIIMIVLNHLKFSYISILLLILTSVAMVTKTIQIRPSRSN